MTRSALATAFCCLLALAASAMAAGPTASASLADPLEGSGGGARAAGMGSAFVGVADDSSALLWNPGGLGTLDQAEIALNHNSWIGGIVQEVAVADLPMGNLGVLGLSGSYVNYGTLTGYDDSGNQLGNYTPSSYGFDVGWGAKVLDRLSAGLALKGAVQGIDGTNYDAYGADLGVLWMPADGLRVGLTGTNLGPQVAGFSLPATLRLGGSQLLSLAPSNRLLLAVSGSWEPQGANYLQFGVEDRFLPLLALRAGYQASLQENQIDGVTGLSLGLGLDIRGFSLDYAFLPYGELGTAQRLSLAYRFGGA